MDSKLLRKIILEEIEKELSSGEEELSGGKPPIPKQGNTRAVGEALADWLNSKGIKAKAHGRPARRNYTLDRTHPLRGGSIEPSLVIDFGETLFTSMPLELKKEINQENKRLREEAWELMKKELGPSKKYRQQGTIVIEYIPWGKNILTLDNSASPYFYRVGIMTKKVAGLKNPVDDEQ